jgi:hypothetical protein
MQFMGLVEVIAGLHRRTQCYIITFLTVQMLVFIPLIVLCHCNFQPESRAHRLGTIGDNNHVWVSELDTII